MSAERREGEAEVDDRDANTRRMRREEEWIGPDTAIVMNAAMKIDVSGLRRT